MNDRGFTIVEALVAFAILSLVLVTLFGAGAPALRSVDRASDVERAVLLARSKLDEIAAAKRPLPESSEGIFTGTDVRWRVEAKGGSGGAMHVQDIHLVLAWTHDGTPREIAVDTRHLGWSAE